MSTAKIKKLKKLRERYIAELPSKLQALDDSWRTAVTDRDTDALSAMRQMAHNLAGSAGTFGFQSISVEAKQLEDILDNLNDNVLPSRKNEDAITRILQRIASLSDLGPEETKAPVVVEYDPEIDESETGRLIYVIDDDVLIANEIANQLKSYDYEVETFTTTARAMDAITKRAPAAMIVDVQMPEGELAGPEFAQWYNQFSNASIPSIFVSARDDWQARLGAVRANGVAYLTKPLDFNELLERLVLVTEKQIPDPYRVLIVEDMEVLAEHYAAVLSDANMEVNVVSDVANLLQTLSDCRPELVLMDICMPQCSGLEAAKIIRQKDELLGVPIVFLSTETDPSHHISAMELGGDDFLQKPIRDHDLVTAVRTRTERFRRLRTQMHSDGLTGLLNHVTIKDRLATEVSRAQRWGVPLCFAMLDIDNFKQVNDTYGHPVGDRVIKSVARILSRRLRKSDLIGRYGGEEFAVVLPETELAAASKVLEEVRENYSRIVQQTDGSQFTCTISIGVAQLLASDSSDGLISAADDALYEAKNSGKNRVCTRDANQSKSRLTGTMNR